MRAAFVRRRALWRLLWRAGRWRLVTFAVLVGLQGLMPILAILASGVLIGAVPEAVATGAGGAAEHRALGGLVLFGASLALGAVLAAVTDYEAQVLDGRYGATVHRAVAAATLGPSGIAGLADARVAGELAAIEEMERADGMVTAVSSLRELLLRRASGAGAFVVLLAFAWWAPLVLLAGWRGLSFGVRRWIEHGMELGSAAGAGGIRRSRYLRSLAVEPDVAKEVRVFGLADRLVRAYADCYLDALRAVWAGRRLGMRSVVAATSGVLAAHLLVLGTLGARAFSGMVSGAQLVVFVQAVLASSALGYVFGAEVPLARAREVAASTLRLRQMLAPGRAGARGPGAAGVAAVTSADRPAPSPSADVGFPSWSGASPSVAVRAQALKFGYPGQHGLTLDGLTLTVPKGQSLAVVGANGAGKSTVMALLCGLYEPDAGSLEILGTDPVAARPRVSAIFQNFTCYALPLRDNVSFGDPAAGHDLASLAAALEDAGAADLPAALPRGWDTVLAAGYPGGQDLSGGQWQKVALARAFIALRGGAELLILDEPTSSLDVRAETELFDRFLDLTRDVTTILVSHRLASVRRAQRIVVLDGGRIVEDGNHEELMSAGGRYAQMFALQASRFTDGPAPEPADPGPAQAPSVDPGPVDPELVDAEPGPAA